VTVYFFRLVAVKFLHHVVLIACNAIRLAVYTLLACVRLSIAQRYVVNVHFFVYWRAVVTQEEIHAHTHPSFSLCALSQCVIFSFDRQSNKHTFPSACAVRRQARHLFILIQEGDECKENLSQSKK
jgi:hypothetical protein